MQETKCTAFFHLPGMLENYELFKKFLPLFREHREYFYDWCDIGSVYDAPEGCLWGGGRIGMGDVDPKEALYLYQEYGISARLTFSNSLLTEEHLSDRKCNRLCRLFEGGKKNGVIVHSELLLNYLKENYPGLYLVSSTTKVITDFDRFLDEVDRDEFDYVVPDFRLNRQFEHLATMTGKQKDKVEFLCNECCYFGCTQREECYRNISSRILGLDEPEHVCRAPGGDEGYTFAKAKKNPGFIGIDDITKIYLPMGFSNFKIEGRELGSETVLEFLLYYMTRPEYQRCVRETL